MSALFYPVCGEKSYLKSPKDSTGLYFTQHFRIETFIAFVAEDTEQNSIIFIYQILMTAREEIFVYNDHEIALHFPLKGLRKKTFWNGIMSDIDSDNWTAKMKAECPTLSLNVPAIYMKNGNVRLLVAC